MDIMNVEHTLTDEQVDRIKMMFAAIDNMTADLIVTLDIYRDPTHEGPRDWDNFYTTLFNIKDACDSGFDNLATKKRLQFNTPDEQLS